MTGPPAAAKHAPSFQARTSDQRAGLHGQDGLDEDRGCEPGGGHDRACGRIAMVVRAGADRDLRRAPALQLGAQALLPAPRCAGALQAAARHRHHRDEPAQRRHACAGRCQGAGADGGAFPATLPRAGRHRDVDERSENLRPDPGGVQARLLSRARGIPHLGPGCFQRLGEEGRRLRGREQPLSARARGRGGGRDPVRAQREGADHRGGAHGHRRGTRMRVALLILPRAKGGDEK